MEENQVYFRDGDCIVVRRDHAERLFTMLGCVNVHKWDEDILEARLRRIGLFCDNDIYIGEYASLVREIDQLGIGGSIILKSYLEPSGPPKDVTEILLSDESIGKKTPRPRKKRKRGPVFSFESCGIPVGATLVLKQNPSVTCKVVGDPLLVDFGDEAELSFSKRTGRCLGLKENVYLSPMHYWLYDGKLLKWYYLNKQKNK